MRGSTLPGVLRLAVPAYLLLLLLLAALGSTNQRLYRSQLRLMDAKETLTTEVADARRRAATINGPTAVANWAAISGMVPVPEALDSVLVAQDSILLEPLSSPSLEIRTLWR